MAVDHNLANILVDSHDEKSMIIDLTKDNTLVKGDFSGGNYFSIQYNDEGDIEWQISPKIKLTFAFIPDKNEITYVKFEKFKKEKKGSPWVPAGDIKLSKFGFAQIIALLDFVANDIDLKGVKEKRLTIADGTLALDDETIKKIKTVLADTETAVNFKDAIEGLLDNEDIVTSKDIVAVGYRKSQIEEFRKLLYEDGYLETYKIHHSITKLGNESAWQYFFEHNDWIWGYGLSYIWSGPFDDDPVEKVVAGHTFFQGGKRADGVLSTMAEIKNFVVVEIKLPEDPLLEEALNPYRSECWRISKEVSGGISQCQKTKHKFSQQVRDKVELKKENGDPTGESIYSIKPRSYLLIGNLNEFKAEHGINEEKLSSFELFRNSNIDPEIITYDELYQRAVHMMLHGEKS